jgi:Reverse transcriptase (RNA-dependent DNA polymerase)
MGCWKGDILTVDDIENNVHHMQNSIIPAYEKACPLRRVKPGQKTPYWSSNLTRLRKVARYAWNHRASDLEAYRTAVREYDRALRREERFSRDQGYTKRVVRKGCPQGGILSPLLWNMVVDQLLRRLNEAHLWAQGFADDVVILINGHTYEKSLEKTTSFILSNKSTFLS